MKPARDDAYLAWVRQQPSCISGGWHANGNEAHHLIGHGRFGTGKNSDYMAMPLTPREHQELHHMGWNAWEAQYGSQTMFALRTLVKAIEDGFFGAGESPTDGPAPAPKRPRLNTELKAKTKVSLTTGKLVARTSSTASPSKCLPRR